MKYVTIAVSDATRKALNDLKRYGDSYSSVIKRLIEVYQLRSAP